jgi:hypothetical protein
MKMSENQEEIFTCEYCSSECNAENIINFDDHDMCQNCYDELTCSCDRCGETIWQSNSVSDDDICLCRACYEAYYNNCEECGRIILEDNCYYEESDDEHDSPYCSNCIEVVSGNKSIKSYNYKPAPIFYGDGLYMGIELEIDGGGESNKNAIKILNIANVRNEHIYTKHDSSLEDGFEIVSHPMNLEYHTNNMQWEKILAEAIEMGYRSHQIGTCGLHVHCSRNALSNDYDEQEEVIARILYFIERSWNEMLIFSRRTEAQINKWAARYGFKDNPKELLDSAKKNNLGRYTCINLNNPATIEFRIFRGTLKYQTFIATLQMVNEICNAAILMSDEDFKKMTWQQFVSKISVEKKPELITYLKLRNLYVNDPIDDETEEI